ncbi:MAG: Calx-beta domain-containing protein, partial [Roseobacter sp.]
VRTVADNTSEADESVSVDVFNVTGATLSNGEERVTVQSVILDDDGTGLKRAAFVSDTTIVEGDNGTTQAVFEVRLSRASDEEISFEYTTVQGSAKSNSDFAGASSAASAPLVFKPGQTVASVAVDIVTNGTSEASENFQLVLTTTSAEIEGGLTGVAGSATILDDDSGFGFFPEISISDGEIVEGTSNFDNLIAFTVSLASPSANPVSMVFEALSGTAIISTDFDPTTSTLTIPAGATTAQIFVRTVADNLEELNETVIVELTSPTNGVFAGGAATLQATGTIIDDDGQAQSPTAPRIIVQDASANEGGTITFTLIRLGQTTEVTSGAFEILPGTANAGSDFVGASGQFTFAAGVPITTVTVQTNEDAISEGNETLVLQLSDVVNGVLPGNATQAYAIGTINGSAIITGTSASETITGTATSERIEARAGNDRVLALAGDDTLLGEDGNDTLNGGDGDDSILGGNGDDRVFAESGNDTLDGGAGNDLLEGKIGNDEIIGGSGNDTLRGSDGFDFINGGSGNDVAFGGNDNDTLLGGDGADTLDGSGGNDLINGENGADVLVGETGTDTLNGGNGNDTLRGGGGNDQLNGGEDNDLLFGSAGEDTVLGGNGNDTLEGDTQADDLFGGNGNDVLRGGDGFDELFGEAGNDTLVGGNGNDTLEGGSGQDTLRGQGNNDTFVFAEAADSAFGSADLIDGIDGVGSVGGDRIDLSSIDADVTSGGDQAFTFLGELTTAQGLAAGPGALWVENVGNQTRVFGSIDNDGNIDLSIRINDGAGTTASDYFLGDFLL